MSSICRLLEEPHFKACDLNQQSINVTIACMCFLFEVMFLKWSMKNWVNNSVCLWYCAISEERVELIFKAYLPKIILIRLEIQ